VGLTELTLRNFRLFTDFQLVPDPQAVTVLLSANGTGKTSVLEAVHMLATGSSFRTVSASDTIRNGESLAEVHGLVNRDRRRLQIDLTIARGARNTVKKMLVNSQRPRSRQELAAALPLTVFTPEGVDVVRQGPEGRRSLLTTLIEDVEPTTAESHERFQRVLTQRNALVRSWHGERPNSHQREELAAWDADFVSSAEAVVALRQRLLLDITPLVQEYYRELSREEATVVLRYEPSWEGSLTARLAEALHHDVQRGYTTIGPHRDDVAILLNGRDARRQASQGEQRSLALALRLAGHDLVRTQREVTPLLLLDDVFSELDPGRSDALLRLLPVGQTLVTTASPLPQSMSPAIVVDVTGGKR
jgi:DNA replication and repair protein RecF